MEINKEDMILAQGQYYSLDCYQTGRNNNVLVVGTSGAGKTRSIVTPNILQATGSYIISDPKGNLHKKYKGYLEAQGYKVKILDFVHPENSAHYNFFNYIHNRQDIVKVAHMLTFNEQYSGKRMDPFWNNSSELLLTAIIAFLYYHRPEKEHTLENVFKLLAACTVEEDKASDKTPLDRIMDEVHKYCPQSYAFKQYMKFRIAASRTLKSILVDVSARLGQFDFDELNEMMAYDDLELTNLGEEKTALFVIVSDTDRSMDMLVDIFYTQAMNALCAYADDYCEDSRLPVPVRFIMDDFATNCKIQNFPRLISSIRSRNISTMLMIQAESQLMQGYGEDGRTIIANCDTYVYLGGNDTDTAKEVARRCDVPLKKILNMPIRNCWIFRRGEVPVYAPIFDVDSLLKERLQEKQEQPGQDVAQAEPEIQWEPEWENEQELPMEEQPIMWDFWNGTPRKCG